MATARDIPATRAARTARIGGLAAGQATRYAGTRAANVARSPERRKLALEQRHLQAADQILTVLGTMKGPAMKIGQLLAFVDLGLLPKSVRPQFQRKLAALCDTAPQIPWTRMEPVLVAGLGRPLEQAFRDIDEEPIGAASIGQVYRATLHDGRDVAVKVQYPGIAAAARADLKNLAMLLRFGQSLAPSIDMRALAAELTSRFTEELDYVQEARNAREIAAAFRGHPFIAVPEPIDEFCNSQVIVTEFVAGKSFNEITLLPADERNRVGEIIVRFFFGGLFRLGCFSGDPHPGNLVLQPDGRVAFFDFGSYKRVDRQTIELLMAGLRAAAENRGEDLLTLLAEQQVLLRADRVSAEQALGYVHDTCGWFLKDATLTMTPRIASAAIIQSLSPATDYLDEMRGQQVPPEHALLVRTVVSSMALLGQLGARANWHRIAREWIYRESPVSGLGQLEADFFARDRAR
jgi:predicted unusual protein kinase regulating ubiquinone biosynthesis (AarF/ABC1/UbiB family)